MSASDDEGERHSAQSLSSKHEVSASSSGKSPSGSEMDMAAVFEEELRRQSHSGDDCSEVRQETAQNLAEEHAGDSRPEPEVREKEKRQKLSDDEKQSGTGAECPPHPAYFGGMCVRCGASKDKDDGGASSSVALSYIHVGLEVSKGEAKRLRDERSRELTSSRKLLLVLDLDHTLLNSTREVNVASAQDRLAKWTESEATGGEDRRLLYHLPHMRMWTKLRPFVKEFLAAVSPMFELYIYTMGNRDYAYQMASVLDPGGKFFNQRIISQNESTERLSKSLDIVLCSESKVLIVDDTDGVWPNHRGNLVRIERYLFFPDSPGHFGLGCSSLLDAGRDEDAHSGALANTLRVLREVHRIYFEEGRDDRDVRRGLAAVKRRVLEGCQLVLSRAFPDHHPLTQLAKELGAICSQEVHAGATHVVAGSLGTEKVRWAEANGVHVVNPRWIEASAHQWYRAEETKYKVDEQSCAEVTNWGEDAKRSKQLQQAADERLTPLNVSDIINRNQLGRD
eukprot:CAMPEP_0177602830 /NCGR_PEP_ID=MMETSP0419_2-20121207/15129_1 /TAXON_ID=582737 /ORGANISM="Tetraselmis sp., Strain GSL018" /LENGTH=508 /DNA_ID=CAMNT_0019096443 /DNA_START=145 /DNA_END=1669 /DNA_ORIENTATION=+